MRFAHAQTKEANGGIQLNQLLLDPIRHNTWAMKELIAFCIDLNLSAEQLERPGVGTYGGILSTLNHVIRSDAGYLEDLVGRAPGWTESAEDTDLDGLKSRAEETGDLWEEFLTRPMDPERVIVVDNDENETHAGIFIAQALNHGTLHREQVCGTLAGLGVEAPDLQVWEYAWATKRLRRRAVP